ncbi:MAG TPA: hypothetical protein VFH43_06380, partial [Candidatus Kapabacteria bacterium]|nr:hypothetical protein [Candidatus Kapabacteria bacterium]
MADFNRNDRNDFGRRSGNLYDRYATERYDRDNTRMNNRERYEWERERYNTGPHNDDTGRPLTGDWRDDERRSRGEGDNDRGFFERAADTVSSWFSGDDDDRRDESPRTRADREREEYYERRYSTEGRGTLGHDRDWNSNFDTRYGAGMEENRHTHTNQDDTWRRDYNNTASFRNEAESSRRYGSQDSNRNYPE